MRTSKFIKWTWSLVTSACCLGPALGHEGHGFNGIHWHPTDLVGFLIAAALVAYVIWKSRK